LPLWPFLLSSFPAAPNSFRNSIFAFAGSRPFQFVQNLVKSPEIFLETFFFSPGASDQDRQVS
jgi:hypothetical protein